MSMYRIRLVSAGWQGAPGLNTFYFQNSANSSITTSDQAVLCAEYVRASFFNNSGLYPSMWTGQVLSEVDVLDPTNGQLTNTYSVPPVTPVVGTGGLRWGPLAVGMCPNLLTDAIVSGQRVRGRAFLTPVADTNDGNGTPTVDQIDWARSIITGMTLGTGGPPQLVVWHRPRAARAATATRPALAATQGSQHRVTGISVKDSFAVLRSRRD